jgi:hypothetical protein
MDIMKLQTKVHLAETSGLSSQRAFSIKASPKAFQIMSSQIYSNKIRAVIRELSCNAKDAHVAKELDIAENGMQPYYNDTPVPFSVRLPTVFEPSFTIRDFGIGMSNDTIEHLYTTYFESTKADSNDFIGALGLGSKSPFSYATNFSIVSYYRGVKSTFFAFIDTDGLPNITPVDSVEVDCSLPENKNGIEIKVAVESGDFNTFKYEANYVFSAFREDEYDFASGHDKPQHMLHDSDEIVPGVFLYTGYRRSSIHVIQGNVIYPVSLKSLQLSAKDQYLHEYSNMAITIVAPMGTVDVSASREEISYIPSTIKFLRVKLKQLARKDIHEARATINGFTNTWELAAGINKLRPLAKRHACLLVSNNNTKFAGMLNVQSNSVSVRTPVYEHMPNRKFNIVKLERSYSSYGSGKFKIPRTTQSVYWPDFNNKKTLFLYSDAKITQKSLLHGLSELSQTSAGRYDHVYWLMPIYHPKQDKTLNTAGNEDEVLLAPLNSTSLTQPKVDDFQIIYDTKAELDALLLKLHSPKVAMMSVTDVAKQAPVEKKEVYEFRVSKYDAGDDRFLTSTVRNSADVDVSKIVYVPLNAFNYAGDKVTVSTDRLMSALYFILQYHMPDVEFVGINATYLKKAEALGLRRAEDVVKDIVSKLKKPELNTISQWGAVKDEWQYCELYRSIAELEFESPAKTLCKNMIAYSKKSNKTDRRHTINLYRTIHTAYGVNDLLVDTASFLDDPRTMLIKRYPMLTYVGTNVSINEEILKYIKLIDTQTPEEI